MQFTDIHSHILPYLDDGAFSREDTLEMAKLADESFVSDIVCTSHASIGCRYSVKDLLVTLEHVSARLERHGCAVKLHPGQEILIKENAAEVLEALKRGSLLTLAGSRYVLIEFPPAERAAVILKAAGTLAGGGCVPVIAHPERYTALHEDEGIAHELHAIGALLQVNKGSVSGYFGRAAYETVMRLLNNRQADFLASDAHSPFGRTPELRSAHEWVSEYISPDYADRLLCRNPNHILNDETVHVSERTSGQHDGGAEHHHHHYY